jgi:polyketide synthase PksM
LPWDEQGRGLAFRYDEWFRQEFADVGHMPPSRAAYRQNGVYVVIGGAGGLGEVWTRHMVADYDADVIWIGRRPQDAEIEAKLDAIAALGRRPHYFAADATDAEALSMAVAAIRERFPRIDGVVHSALVLQDQTVRAMDEAVFRQSLAAKVDVSVNIERAFAGQALDFVLFFSSVSSFYRGAGQSNYCAGCTFKDSFAQAMRARHPYPVKIVNWGYWGSVGVVTDAFYRKRMESMGFGSIEPDEAMRALETFVASGMDQLALIKVIAERALDDLLVSEELRYYPDHDVSGGYGGEAVIAS